MLYIHNSCINWVFYFNPIKVGVLDAARSRTKQNTARLKEAPGQKVLSSHLCQSLQDTLFYFVKDSQIFIEAISKALQTVCSRAVRQVGEAGDCLASDSCLKGFLMTYLMGLDDRQSFEAVASRLTPVVNSQQTTRRFYLYQVGQLIFFNRESSKQIGEAA